MPSSILKQISISDLLAITALVALVVWTGVPHTRLAVVRFIASIALVAIYATIRFRKLPSLRVPAAATLLYFAASIGCRWTLLWGGYLLSTPAPNSAPYFEDGMIAEGIIYPMAYFVVYSPFVVAVAFAVSTVTLLLDRRISGRFR